MNPFQSYDNSSFTSFLPPAYTTAKFSDGIISELHCQVLVHRLSIPIKAINLSVCLGGRADMNQIQHKCRIDNKCQAYTYNEEAWNYKECYLHQTNQRLYIDPWIIVGVKISDPGLQGGFSDILGRLSF